MPRILVTGGTGYIGSHTVVELLGDGMDVVIIDNLVNSEKEVLDGITEITGKKPAFEKVDLRSREATFGVFEKYPDIEAIIHFAAFKAVGESVEKPLDYYHNNLLSLIHLLEAMKQYAVPRIVFSSSCTVYGEPDSLPVTEEAPIKKANSPYGNTKQICEEILQDTLESNPDYRVISLRYFNPIGAHPTAKIGELPLGIPSNLVPFITQTAIGVREHLRVFGDNYNTPDGSAIRDYINVVDLARAHVVAIGRLLEKKQKNRFEVFNLGTGKGFSVFEIIRAFEKATGETLQYKVVDRREGDVEQVYADTSYANNELGWKAERGIEETLLSAWNWEKYIRSKKSAL
ncbi:MAG: UDP-glucose 4-epimerase GalE [Bacteroidales bacterium]|nr:UDP-glucose 4-epimerase GalE [Bacteroidales bacterium]